MVTPSEEPFFDPDPVELDVGFGSPRQQSRVTVLFRSLLALPHVVVLLVLLIPALPLWIIGHWAALFLGRLPRWIAVYWMSVIAYSLRVNAYQYMLVNEFPPFSLRRDADYPLRIEIGASRIPRLKVLFRGLLAIPAGMAFLLASEGLGLFAPIIWIVTLVRGRMPQSFFNATAAVLRYEARFFAYFILVTDSYPRKLFGDEESDFAPEGPGRELRVQRAKGLVVLFIVLGLVGFVGEIVLQDELRAKANPALVAAEQRLENASKTYLNSIQGCKTLSCVETKDRAWGESFNTFASDLSRVPFKGSQAAQAATLAHDARKIGQALLATAKTKTGVDHDKAFLAVQHLLPTFEADATTLLGHGL